MENLPKEAIFHGYENYFVQEIEIRKKVTLYKRKAYLLPNGTRILADLPKGINGHFGNELKQYIVYQNSVNNVSQVKIKQELKDFGIEISEGKINNIIIDSSKIISQEYEDVMRAGIITARELCVDDTGSRHKGENGCSLVVQNDLFTIFASSFSKSRMQFLKVLRGKSINYFLNDVSLDFLEKYKPTEQLKHKLLKLKNINFVDKNSWDKALIKAKITPMTVGANLLMHIEEAGILGSAIEHGVRRDLVILSDGATQYNLLSHAACWMHAERAIKKLVPIDEIDAAEIEKIRGDIWNFYAQLQNYKKIPEKRNKIAIEKKFDEIFTQTVTSEQLAVAMRKFRLNKNDLLRVLDYPFIDLHNNSSEREIRSMVIKKNIAGQTRSDEGRYARDAFVSLIKTCRKHDISVWEYFTDRINSNNKIPYLPDLICQKAKLFLDAPS